MSNLFVRLKKKVDVDYYRDCHGLGEGVCWKKRLLWRRLMWFLTKAAGKTLI